MRDTPPSPSGSMGPGEQRLARRGPTVPAVRIAAEGFSRAVSWGREKLAERQLRQAAASEGQPEAAAVEAPDATVGAAAFPRFAGHELAAGREGESEETPAPSPWTLRDRLADLSERFTGRFGEVWWIGSGDPITLSLPRGATVLVVSGVVAIIVMAFVAGRRSGPAPVFAVEAGAVQTDRGGAAVAVASPSPSRALVAESVPGGSEWLGPIEARESSTPDAGRLQARFDAGMDPRVDGLNYLVYMTATRRECLRLADFLNERGVQAIVMGSSRSVHSAGPDGERVELPLYWVVDVGQGFSRNQYLRGEHQGFRDERMELGRAWKRHNAGRGSDLSDMQFYAYRKSTP